MLHTRTGQDYSGLIEHHAAEPPRPKRLPRPVPARCTARTYGGELVTVEGVVTHRAGELLSFCADYSGWGPWISWVRRDACEPL